MTLDTGGLVAKDPNATGWPRVFDWEDQLAEFGAGVTITVSAWSVSGADSALTIDTSSIVTGALQTQVKLSGGTVGVKYTLTNRITTSSGTVDDRSETVLVEHL